MATKANNVESVQNVEQAPIFKGVTNFSRVATFSRSNPSGAHLYDSAGLFIGIYRDGMVRHGRDVGEMVASRFNTGKTYRASKLGNKLVSGALDIETNQGKLWFFVYCDTKRELENFVQGV